MKSVEVSAKTLDDAITSALLQLGASSDQVDIKVIEEGSRGILGMFSKDYKIQATLKDDEEPVIPQSQEPAKGVTVQEVVTATGEKMKVDDSLEKRIREANAKREKKEENRQEKPHREREERQERPRRENQPRREREERPAPVPAVAYEIPADAEEVQVQLKEFLMGVLNAMGIEATITTAFSAEGILEADIAGDAMGVIIGKRGNTLDSLQYLATLVVNKGRHDHVHIKLDTEGYRGRRQATLESLALSIAKKVRKSGHKVTLEPMNPYERRIIHSVLQNEHGVETYSDGEEPYRKVIIAPKRYRR